MAGLRALEKRKLYGDYCENIELYKTSGFPGGDGEDYRLLGCVAM